MGVETKEELKAIWDTLDCETYRDFQRHVENGKISMENQLGVLLGFLRFSGEPLLDELGNCLDVENDDIEFSVGYAAGKICIPYGLSHDSPCTFIQHIDEKGLEGFVQDWASRGEEWNPPFVKAELPLPVEDYCRAHTVREVIRKFNIYGAIDREIERNSRSRWEPEKSDEFNGDLLFPFDEYQLARALELAYYEDT